MPAEYIRGSPKGNANAIGDTMLTIDRACRSMIEITILHHRFPKGGLNVGPKTQRYAIATYCITIMQTGDVDRLQVTRLQL